MFRAFCVCCCYSNVRAVTPDISHTRHALMECYFAFPFASVFIILVMNKHYCDDRIKSKY